MWSNSINGVLENQVLYILLGKEILSIVIWLKIDKVVTKMYEFFFLFF